MKKVYLMKGMAAMALGLVVASCNKFDAFNPYAEQEAKQQKFSANFQKSVMVDKTIDPNQTWATTTPVQVSVTPRTTGTLKIYTANPIGNVVASLYTADVTAGTKTTFTVAKPADVSKLYAAVINANGMIDDLLTFDATDNADVNFNATSSNRAARRAAPTRPFVPTYDTTIPATIFTTPVEPTGIPTSANAAEKYTASSSSGVYLNGDKTIYIAENVELSNVTGIGDRCKIYMASGSKLVFNSEMPINSGTVIYNDGGTIEAKNGIKFDNAGTLWNKGTVELNNNDIYYSNDNGYIYNSGLIKDVKDFTVGQGGTLWNVGTIRASGKLKGYNTGSKIYNGNSANDSIYVGSLDLGNSSQYFWNDGKVTVTGAITFTNSGAKFANHGTLKGNSFDISAGSQFVNYADCNVIITGATDITNANAIWINNGTYQSGTFMVKAGGNQVFNNCRLTVKGKFTMGNNDGSYFVLQGDASVICESFDWVGDNYFWMGADSWLKVNGTLKSNNNNNDGKGFIQYGENMAVISADAITTDNANSQARFCVFGKVCVDANSIFDLTTNNHIFQGNVTQSGKMYTAIVPEAWKTESTCRPAYTPGQQRQEGVQWYYYAFEDLGTTDDFDFNDVIIRVSAPVNNVSTVQLVAAGGTLSTIVTYGTGENKQVVNNGQEVHAAFGASSVTSMVNTGSGETKDFVSFGTVPVADGANMANLPFGITVQGNNDQITTVVRDEVSNKGQAPLVVVVSGYPSGTNAGKWFWPKERITISTAYPEFGEWGSSVATHTDWYTEGKDAKDKNGNSQVWIY